MPIVVTSVAGQPEALGAKGKGKGKQVFVAELVPRNCTLKTYKKKAIPSFAVRGDVIAYASPDSTFAVTKRLFDAAKKINRDRHLRLHRRSRQATAGRGDESGSQGRADARSRRPEGRRRVSRSGNAGRRLHAGAVVRQQEQQVLSFIARKIHRDRR